MGKKRIYCPYCDVYLVHNSLRARRDHNSGFKHIAAFSIYYHRFLPQHLAAGGSLTNQNSSDSNSADQGNAPRKLPIEEISLPKVQLSIPSFPSRPSTAAPPKPPSILPLISKIPKLGGPPKLQTSVPTNNTEKSKPSIPLIPNIKTKPITPAIAPKVPTIPSISLQNPQSNNQPALPKSPPGPPSLPKGPIGPPSMPKGPIGPPSLPKASIGPPKLGAMPQAGPPALPRMPIGPPQLSRIGPPPKIKKD